MKPKNFPLFLSVSIILLCLSGCGSQLSDRPSTLGAGFRYSTYGVQGNPSPEYWVSVGEGMAGKFSDAAPETIWIVGNIYGNGTYLNFPCNTDDPLIKCGFIDMNEEALNLFDERGIRVWLQVEPGNANLDKIIKIVLDHYRHHSSIVGFGLDVEWYRSPEGPLGVPITDNEARHWVEIVRAYNPNYRLFLKHWEIDWMPPNERAGILFINDNQNFESMDALLENFSAWGEYFESYPVGYQFGYPSDRKWWREFNDPAREIGNAILDNIDNTQALYWVDFTVHEIFPLEP